MPAGATSGAISVSNTNGSATSSATFTVGAVAPAPIITSFTPQIGNAGTIVAVTGANFQLVPETNKTTLGGVAATVLKDGTSPTENLLRFSVPNGAPSGKISVATPYGKATSAADFYGLPSTVNAADVEFKGRLTVDGPSISVVTTSPGKKAVLLFDGTAGQALHLLPASGTFASAVSVAIYAPDGRLVESLSLGNQSFVNFANRVFAGTYTIILSPQATDSGTASASLIADVSGTLTVDGSTAVSLSGGRSGRYRFTAEAAKGYGLALAGFTITPAGGLLYVTLRKADGTGLATCYIYGSGDSCTFDPSLFAGAGAYMIDFVPSGIYATTFNAVFSKDTGGVLTVDAAAATTVTIAREGQNGRYTFSGTAGQAVSIVLSAMVGMPSRTFVQLYRPSDGAAIDSMNIYNGAGGTLNVTLPQTGAYSLLVDPSGLDKGSIDVRVTQN